MALVSKTFSQIITFTRASTATYFDSAGVLQSAAIDTPRFDYDPDTLAARGFLIEEARTNSIRNNTMQGAVAGTPGTLPTNWGAVGAGLGTLTQQIVGTGTSAGITYIDIRLSGTTSTGSYGFNLESNTQITAAVGQTWACTSYVAIVGGSTSNITTAEIRIVDRSAAGANLGVSITNFVSSLTSTFTRAAVTRTLSGVGTAFVSGDILFTFSSGVAIDFTLRIGLPQLEQGAFATSVIPTTTTALTRSADVASVNTLSPWYNATEGTLYAEGEWIALVLSRQVAILNNSATPSSDLISIQTNPSTATSARANVVVGGSNQAAMSIVSAFAINTVFKAAHAYKQDDFAFTVNGATPATDTSGTLPTVDQMQLGAISTTPSNIYLRRITYYPRRLSNAELQSITA